MRESNNQVVERGLGCVRREQQGHGVKHKGLDERIRGTTLHQSCTDHIRNQRIVDKKMTWTSLRICHMM